MGSSCSHAKFYTVFANSIGIFLDSESECMQKHNDDIDFHMVFLCIKLLLFKPANHLFNDPLTFYLMHLHWLLSERKENEKLGSVELNDLKGGKKQFHDVESQWA